MQSGFCFPQAFHNALFHGGTVHNCWNDIAQQSENGKRQQDGTIVKCALKNQNMVSRRLSAKGLSSMERASAVPAAPKE